MLLEALNDLLEKGVADDIEIGDGFLLVTSLPNSHLDPLRNQANSVFTGQPCEWEVTSFSLVGDVLGASLGQRAESYDPFSHAVAPETPSIDQDIEVLVNRLESFTDDGPVGLLADQVEVDEVDQCGLQGIGDLGGGCTVQFTAVLLEVVLTKYGLVLV